jgi:predicted enzyme related to lactoylglutathione lyase
VRELGATLVGEKLTIPNVGFLQYAQDPDGNVFGMMEPVTEAATV